jgi:hypothetical protein
MSLNKDQNEMHVDDSELEMYAFTIMAQVGNFRESSTATPSAVSP